VTKLLQLTIDGTALGVGYALVALGFVVIYRATGVINFSQGGFVLLGAYLTYNFHVTWGLNFWVSVALAVVIGALVGVLIEALILRRMVGQPVFAVIILTIGLLFVMEQSVSSIWGFDNLNMSDPWGIGTSRLGDFLFGHKQVAAMVVSALMLTAFFAYFKYSVMGVSMRAVALDQEAALAQGISARKVFAVSWAIAGAVAAMAGMLQGAGPASVELGISFVALRAFPAMILGGLDSPGGAVVGGIVIGVVQNFTAGYQPEIAPWLGNNFHLVMPYVVMVIILMVKPYGLFGTPEVHRA